jgi:5-methylcytosine-specific restriction endonuclease McrA
MRAIRISYRTAQKLASLLQGDEAEVEQLRAELRQALKPKRAVKAAKTRRTAKATIRRDAWAEVREAVVQRALGDCEACECPIYGPAEVDHFFGGNGRRRSLESVATCWALCADCHWLKTRNDPSAAYWPKRFAEHCMEVAGALASRGAETERINEYLGAAAMARTRLESLQIQGRAT